MIVGWSMYKDRSVAAGASSVRDSSLDLENRRVVDSCIQLLKTGDLLLRTGNDMTSRIFRELNQTNKTYSHAGLVVIEDGYPFVYHSIGGEDNPEERLRRDSASFFLSPQHNLGFAIARFHCADSIVGSMESEIKGWYARRPRFDMDFNLQSDDKLYCSEFVFKVMVAATGDPEFIPKSSVLGYSFVGIDNLFMNSHTFFVCELKYK
jgi:hypothetical protein